jgi:hypothetical protein
MPVVYGGLGSDGPNGVYPWVDGKAGRGSGTAVASANEANTGVNAKVTEAEAYASYSGHGGNGADAGYDINGVYYAPGAAGAGTTGGNAYATAKTVTTLAANALAISGTAGASGVPGHLLTGELGGTGNKGGAGGFAMAVSSDYNTLMSATATSVASAGDGGTSYGPLKVGGAGGAVGGTTAPSSAAAGSTAVGATVSASLTQSGGSGGSGLYGASGGAGAASSLTNMVTGYSNGGVLSLTQIAVGGSGGDSETAIGGKAGAATSRLTFDDTLSATQSAVLSARLGAVAGGAGAGATNGAVAAAASTLVLTGVAAVHGSTYATGGTGITVAGTGTACTTVTGATGDVAAAANTALRPGKLVQSVAASATGGVDGVAVAKAVAGIGVAAANFATAGPIATINGAPLATSVSGVLSVSPNLTAAYGTTASVFGMGELGGRHSSLGTDTQTITSSLSETVDTTVMTPGQDLMLGFYKGTVAGGFTSLTLDVYVNGVDEVHEAFTSASAAKTYFTDHAVDLGPIGAGDLTGGALDIQAVMSITTSKASSGFFGGILIGDPATAAVSPSATAFTQSMATLDSSPGSATTSMTSGAHAWRPLLASAA